MGQVVDEASRLNRKTLDPEGGVDDYSAGSMVAWRVYLWSS